MSAHSGESTACPLADAKLALLAMTVESAELQAVVDGSMSDAVAAWLAPQYALAARRRLAAAPGDGERFDILRAFVQDWALLRHGDQVAERLQIVRARLAMEDRDSTARAKRKINAGLEALLELVKAHPKAQATFDKLVAQLHLPFDPDGNPTESD